MNIEAIKSSVVTGLEKVWVAAQWLGRKIVAISKEALILARTGVEKLGNLLSKLWALSQPLLIQAWEFIKTHMGVFAVGTLAAIIIVRFSQNSEESTHRYALGILGIACAMVAGMALAGAGYPLANYLPVTA